MLNRYYHFSCAFSENIIGPLDEVSIDIVYHISQSDG